MRSALSNLAETCTFQPCLGRVRPRQLIATQMPRRVHSHPMGRGRHTWSNESASVPNLAGVS
ncbi:hypothetical protein [Kibdelosporangium philippinense]|uniref:hypothetical protein n=1 Tax=Kibdelosporangium philippinense TaxID=211113 RepID=UPI00360BA38E